MELFVFVLSLLTLNIFLFFNEKTTRNLCVRIHGLIKKEKELNSLLNLMPEGIGIIDDTN